MIKNVEMLRPGDTREFAGRTWEVEGAELQDGLMQVLWRGGDERQWQEYEPGTPVIVTPAPAVQRIRSIKNASALVIGDRRVGRERPPFEVAAIEHMANRVVVDWSNGSEIRIREYDGLAGLLVESLDAEDGPRIPGAHGLRR